jgi:hypothetical protein
MSFTHFYKGHTIHVRPREGEQRHLEFSSEVTHFKKELRMISLKEIIQNNIESIKHSQELIPPTLNSS